MAKAMQTDENPLKTYRGNCHCCAFVFEIQVPEITSVVACNCSVCQKKAYGWVFPAAPDHYKVIKGQESDLTAYAFGRKTMNHLFCPTCGTPILARRPNAESGTLGAGVNARTLQGLISWDLTANPVDGAAAGDLYDAPVYTGPEPAAEIADSRIYTGSCHCGAVTLALKSKPLELEEVKLMECNCSICQRNGYIWTYPKSDQVVIQGSDKVVRYAFGKRHLEKTFCRTCGVQLTNEWRVMTDEDLEAMTETERRFYEGFKSYRPVNVRVLNGFDLGGVKPERSVAGSKMGVEYVNP